VSARATPGPLPLKREPVCPFRNEARATQFAVMVADYRLRNASLFNRANDTENRGNNIGEAFWRGWHGEPFIWDRSAPIFVAYKAGASIAKATA
jgi:hypothetical protein